MKYYRIYKFAFVFLMLILLWSFYFFGDIHDVMFYVGIAAFIYSIIGILIINKNTNNTFANKGLEKNKILIIFQFVFLLLIIVFQVLVWKEIKTKEIIMLFQASTLMLMYLVYGQIEQKVKFVYTNN